MEPKSEVRHPLNRHPPGDPVKKGAICNPCIIYYVSSTSALLEKVTFSLHWGPQNEGKIGSATEVAKKHHKTHAKGAEGEPQGRLWGPKGSPGSPKWLSNPIEIRQKTEPLSRCPPKGCQGYKISKIKQKLTRSCLHPSEKIRSSNAPHETSSEKGSRRLAAYIEQLSGHNSTAHTWSRGTSKKHCLSLELDD